MEHSLPHFIGVSTAPRPKIGTSSSRPTVKTQSKYRPEGHLLNASNHSHAFSFLKRYTSRAIHTSPHPPCRSSLYRGQSDRPRNPILRVLTLAYAADKDAQTPRMTFAGRRETLPDRAWAQRRTEASQAQPDHSFRTPLSTGSPSRTLALQAMGRVPSHPQRAIRPQGWWYGTGRDGTGRDDSSLLPAFGSLPFVQQGRAIPTARMDWTTACAAS